MLGVLCFEGREHLGTVYVSCIAGVVDDYKLRFCSKLTKIVSLWLYQNVCSLTIWCEHVLIPVSLVRCQEVPSPGSCEL